MHCGRLVDAAGAAPGANRLLAPVKLYHRAIVGEMDAAVGPVLEVSDEVFAAPAVGAASGKRHSADQGSVDSRVNAEPVRRGRIARRVRVDPVVGKQRDGITHDGRVGRRPAYDPAGGG